MNSPSTLPSLNINEASKSCGLSPSVLRIWELRYGWPSPKRKSNGYRTYSLHQVQELKRVAALVKAGTPISSLIIDGLPRWPSDVQRSPSARTLSKTRSLSAPTATMEAALHRELIDALEMRKAPQVKELLQRIFWSVRPTDEPRTALVPALVAVAELRQAARALEGERDITTMILERCVQLLRMLKTQEQPLLVIPAQAGDEALAALVALILCYRQVPAAPHLDGSTVAAGGLMVSESEIPPALSHGHLGRLTALGEGDAPGLGSLLDGTIDLPQLRLAAQSR